MDNPVTISIPLSIDEWRRIVEVLRLGYSQELALRIETRLKEES